MNDAAQQRIELHVITRIFLVSALNLDLRISAWNLDIVNMMFAS